MGHGESGSVLRSLSDTEHLLRKLTPGLVLRTNQIVHPQSEQHRQKLSGISELPAQLSRPSVDLSNFRGPVTLAGDERIAEGELQRKFLLVTFGRFRQGFEQLQPFREVTDRLDMCRALGGSLSCDPAVLA